jgi:hypothetical protein
MSIQIVPFDKGTAYHTLSALWLFLKTGVKSGQLLKSRQCYLFLGNSSGSRIGLKPSYIGRKPITGVGYEVFPEPAIHQHSR